MSTYSKSAAFSALVCLLGIAASAYAPVFGEPSAEKAPHWSMRPGQIGIAVAPLTMAIESAPLSYTFQIQDGEKGIVLVPTRSIGKPLNPFVEPGTFQPIPTHWDRNPFALIPGHWNAKTILLSPPSMLERSRIASLATE